MNSRSALKSSAFRLFGPGALPFLRDLRAVIISSLVGGVVMTSISISASCISGYSVGGGLFSTSQKCSAHRASCSSLVESSFPFLSLIGRLLLLYFPQMSFVILYTLPCSPFIAASSAWLVSRSVCSLLSFLTLFLTSLLCSWWSALYFSCSLVHLA